MFTSRRPRLMGTLLYTQSESVLPRTPIKVGPWAHDSFTTSPPPTCPTNRTLQVGHIMATGSLPPPSGVTDPQPPLAGHIPARLEPSSASHHQKRKRDVGAADGEETGEGRPPVHERRRQAQFDTLPEAQQSDPREGKLNEHGQLPVQPQPRRSARIQERNKRCTPLPKVETPAKPASRKRAVRKK